MKSVRALALTLGCGGAAIACNTIFGLDAYEKRDAFAELDVGTTGIVDAGGVVDGDASASLNWARWPMPNGADAGPNPTAYVVSKEGTNEVVSDGVTKLIWQRSASSKMVNKIDANAQCANLGAGWRLPTRIELVSLLDYGRAALPYIDTIAFPGAPGGQFWTSSLVRSPTNWMNTWSVDFGQGEVTTSGSESERYVRCVRLP